MVVVALLLEGILDLEKICEVASDLEADLEFHWSVVVVEDRELLPEAVADRPLADH